MSAKAYIILKGANAPRLQSCVLSLTGPYLFRAEAEAFATAISAACGSPCQISTIMIERALLEVVKNDDRLLVTSVWNIAETQEGFAGEAILSGMPTRVQRVHPDQPWQVIK
jgi:hypothetical protein